MYPILSEVIVFILDCNANNWEFFFGQQRKPAKVFKVSLSSSVSHKPYHFSSFILTLVGLHIFLLSDLMQV